MEFKSIEGAFIAQFFDPSSPIIFVVTLPALTLALLGRRGLGILYFLGAVGFMAVTGRF